MKYKLLYIKFLIEKNNIFVNYELNIEIIIIYIFKIN